MLCFYKNKVVNIIFIFLFQVRDWKKLLWNICGERIITVFVIAYCIIL